MTRADYIISFVLACMFIGVIVIIMAKYDGLQKRLNDLEYKIQKIEQKINRDEPIFAI